MPFTQAEFRGMNESELKRATERIDRAIDDLRKDRGLIEQELVNRVRDMRLTEDDLRQRWPAAFNDQRLPLKIGIHTDMGLTEQCDAMRWWVNHPAYLRNVIAGGERIDLEGKSVGEIKEHEQAFAWSALQLRRFNIAAAMESRRRRLPLPHPCIGVAVADQGARCG